ncbi:MAG: SufE family protein [Microscillaceae bacterium]|nr:SufE family protein [Microscillaceae bacterium]
MRIEEIQNEIIEEFSLFDDWEDRYAYLIELGKKLPALPEQYKTDEYKIKGCQSNVWVHPSRHGEQLIFEGDSDALIVRGLVSVLIRVLSGQPPAEVAQADLYFLDKIGMTSHLSMTRANGLAAMIKQLKLYGLAFEAQKTSEN